MTSDIPHPIKDIWVFKTNLRFEKDIRQIEPILNSQSAIIKWNVDQEDQDNVLRVESHSILPQIVIHLVKQAGYFCEELPD